MSWSVLRSTLKVSRIACSIRETSGMNPDVAQHVERVLKSVLPRSACGRQGILA